MGTYCLECPDRIDIKPKRTRMKGDICADCVIRTGRPNPPRQLETKETNRRIAGMEATAYHLPTTVEKNAAYITGKAAFDAEFRGISEVYPERKVTISVVVHSDSSSVSFNKECCDGSLVGGKKKSGYRKFKIVRLDFKHGIDCWRGLWTDKRQTLSVHQGSEVFFSDNRYLAEHVEEKLHLHVQSLELFDEKITLLQSRVGNGGCMSAGPFRVGVRFIVHEEDGSLPLPRAIFRDDIPEGMPNFNYVVEPVNVISGDDGNNLVENRHDVVEPAKPRAVKRKVSE